MLRIVVAFSVLLLTACATVAEREASKKQWSDGVIVALNMCAQDHSLQHSTDQEGQRACCGETPVGTHVPKCVCHDEGQSALDREQAQRYMRDSQEAHQVVRVGGN